MRVLHLLPSHLFAIGGMEDFTRNLALRLERHGISVEVWHLPLRAGARLMRDPPTLVANDLHVLNVSRYRFPCFDPRRLRHYDLIHVHGIGGLTDFTALSRLWHGRPVLVSTHGGIFHTRRFWRLKQWYFKLVQPVVARNAAAFVACSVNDRDLFAPVCPRLELIENGVELFQPPLTGKNPYRWVWIGRWSHNKELPSLMRAVALARQQLPDAHLDIVGSPDDLTRVDLERLAGECGLTGGLTIHEAVPRSDLAKVLGNAGLTLSAARHEGFGLAVIEAMSAGCVPVVNDIPVFQRFTREAGVGRTCDFINSAATAVALCETAAKLAVDSTDSSRAANFAKRYGWDAVEERWLALYRRLARDAAHD